MINSIINIKNKYFEIINKNRAFGLEYPSCFMIFLYLFIHIINNTDYFALNILLTNFIFDIIYYCLFILIIYNLSNSKISNNRKIIFIILFFISLINYKYFTFKKTFLLTLCSAFALSNNKIKKLARFVFYSMLLIIVLIFINYLRYIFVNNIDIVFDKRVTGFTYNFGFGQHNTFGSYITNMTLLCLLAFNRNKKNYLLLLLINMFFLITVNSRTSFIVSIFSMFLFIVVDKCKMRYLFLIGKYSFIIFSTLLFIITFLYIESNELAIIINNLLSSRIFINSLIVDKAIPSFFGSYEDVSALIGGYAIDSLYPFLIYKYGIIIFIVITFIFYSVSNKNINNNYISICILLFSFYGLSEHTMLNYTNYSALLIILVYYFQINKDNINLLQ